MKLIITDTNWADEMDVWGFEVISDEVFSLYTRVIEEAFKFEDNIVVYIGTNEEIEINKNNYLRHFEVKDITKEQIESLNTIFGSDNKGLNFLERIVETCFYRIEDEDQELFYKLNEELESLL